MVKEPLDPTTDDPVDNTIEPDVPVYPELAVLSNKLPELVTEPDPVIKLTFPPEDREDRPADITS